MKKETAIRLAANGLPVFRMAVSPMIAEKIRTTEPEDRSIWLTAGVAAVAATDKLDGLLARKIGPSKLGGWLDQFADKKIILDTFKALADTGEISRGHFGLKIARDIGVTALRLHASRRGMDVDAKSLGKYKTVAEMGTLVVAASPLSQKPHLVEGLATTSTVLSMASGLQYAREFTR